VACGRLTFGESDLCSKLLHDFPFRIAHHPLRSRRGTLGAMEVGGLRFTCLWQVGGTTGAARAQLFPSPGGPVCWRFLAHLETDLLRRPIGRSHELADRLEDQPDILVMLLNPLFKVGQFPS